MSLKVFGFRKQKYTQFCCMQRSITLQFNVWQPDALLKICLKVEL